MSIKSFCTKFFIVLGIVCINSQLPDEPNATAYYANHLLFQKISSYSTLINGDESDIYYPLVSPSPSFPIVIMLSGALVDKNNYSNYATMVASYGFIVIVSNHFQISPTQGKVLLADASQINSVLNFIQQENLNNKSPIYGIVEAQKLGLLGHSYGGAVGMIAIENNCILPFCHRNYTRPEQLKVGIFYGTHRQDLKTKKFSETNNQGIPLALIHGTLDSVASPEEVIGTYQFIKQAPKALITVEGANHYGITNNDNRQRDSSTPSLPQTVAIETIARWSGLFLRAHMLNDTMAIDYIYHSGDQLDNHVTVEHEQPKKED